MRSRSNPEILTVAQTAVLLQTSKRLVYMLIRRGDLKAKRVGVKNWRIARSQVMRFCGHTEGAK